MTTQRDDSRSDYDYVVIGSGFGGSVSALRLSEKGYRVAVLEMGRRFAPSDFPKTNWNVGKFLWSPALRSFGLQQITPLKDVLIFHAAGVGGGSLIYANTLPTPPDEAFRDAHWPKGSDWKARLSPFYDLARFMLGAAKSPELFPADKLLKEIVREAGGREESFEKHPQSIYFGDSTKTVDDPFFGGEGPARRGCTLCGSCMSGCRDGGKNTLDKNYLYLAERRGAVIHPETKVVDVRPRNEGGYDVQTVCSTSLFGAPRRTFRATKGVVFSAGVLGSVQLLFDCKKSGALPNLSDRLGDFVRTNSEAILAVSAKDDAVDYSRGIAITSGIELDAQTHVEIVRYGAGHDFMSLMTTLLTGGGPPWPRWSRWLGNAITNPVDFARASNPFGWARRTAILLVMQPISSYMKLRPTFTGRIDSQLVEGQRVPTYFEKANDLAKRFAEKMNGVPQSLLLEVLGNRASTAHILGGAVMGDDRGSAVCGEDGQIFGYPGLYVCDGSLVPANLGVNPSLTITALSEFVMSQVPEHVAGEKRPAPRPKGWRASPAASSV